MINNKSPMEILCRGPMFQVELKELLAWWWSVPVTSNLKPSSGSSAL
jgi:hypothetical protein